MVTFVTAANLLNILQEKTFCKFGSKIVANFSDKHSYLSFMTSFSSGHLSEYAILQRKDGNPAAGVIRHISKRGAQAEVQFINPKK